MEQNNETSNQPDQDNQRPPGSFGGTNDDVQPAVVGVQPQKYTVFQSAADVAGALKVNWRTVILVALMFIASWVLVSLLSGLLLMGVAGGSVAGGLVSAAALNPSTIGSLLGILIVVALLMQSMSIIFSNAMSLSFLAGMQKQRSSVAVDFKLGLKRFPRVLVVEIILILVVLAPILIALLLSAGATFASSASGMGPSAGLSAAAFLIGVVGIVWVFYALLQYALAPVVALFEPEVSLTKTLARSKYLLVDGGRWFLAKVFGLLILIFFVIGIVSGDSASLAATEPDATSSWIGNLVSIVLIPFMIGVPVALYLNRKVVKG